LFVDPARLSHSLQHLDPNRKAYRLLPVRPGRYRWGLQNIERVLTFRLYLAEEGFSVHKERKVRQHRAMVFVSECYCGQATPAQSGNNQCDGEQCQEEPCQRGSQQGHQRAQKSQSGKDRSTPPAFGDSQISRIGHPSPVPPAALLFRLVAITSLQGARALPSFDHDPIEAWAQSATRASNFPIPCCRLSTHAILPLSAADRFGGNI
jgi:hypothetical protein